MFLHNPVCLVLSIFTDEVMIDERDHLQGSASSDDEAGMLLSSSGVSSARYFSKKKTSRNKL